MALTRAKLEELIAAGAIAADFELADVSAVDLPNGSPASASLTIDGSGVHLVFGIPEGDTGPQGPQGVQGIQGPKGDAGNVMYATFEIDSDGNLIMKTPSGYAGPNFRINDDTGCLEVVIGD